MLKRIWSLVVGFVTFGLVKLEESNPQLLLERLNSEIDKKVQSAREQMIQAKVNLKITEKQANKVKEQLNNIQNNIQTAIKVKDEDLLVQLYLQEKEQQKTNEMIQKLFNDVKTQFENAEKEYKLFKIEMESKRTKIEAFKAQSQVTKMRKDMLKAINIEFTEVDFERTEKIIDKQSFEVDAIQEMDEENTSTKIKKINMNADLKEARVKARVAIEG